LQAVLCRNLAAWDFGEGATAEVAEKLLADKKFDHGG
jgi:hypothetical protein